MSLPPGLSPFGIRNQGRDEGEKKARQKQEEIGNPDRDSRDRHDHEHEGTPQAPEQRGMSETELHV